MPKPQKLRDDVYSPAIVATAGINRTIVQVTRETAVEMYIRTQGIENEKENQTKMYRRGTKYVEKEDKRTTITITNRNTVPEKTTIGVGRINGATTR